MIDFWILTTLFQQQSLHNIELDEITMNTE
jgi:hypothetical protein